MLPSSQAGRQRCLRLGPRGHSWGCPGRPVHLPFGPMVLAVGSHFVCKKKGKLGCWPLLGSCFVHHVFLLHLLLALPATARPTGGAGGGRVRAGAWFTLRLAPLCLSAQTKPAAPQRGPFQSVEVKWPLRGKGWTYCVCPVHLRRLSSSTVPTRQDPVLVSEVSSHPPPGLGHPLSPCADCVGAPP